MDFQILDWDSHFFGFKTAEILPHQLDENALIKVLDQLRADRVRLVYWPAQKQTDFNCERLGGWLADKKVTFIAGLRSLDIDNPHPIDQVEKFRADMPEEALLNLAVQAGHFSRFARDPHFPQDKFIALYHEWMRKCLSGEKADEVLVIQQNKALIGMVTVQNAAGTGDIGLIAVDTAYRGRHYGEMLVRAAQRWFLNHNLNTAQVTTQTDNHAACSLYQKCGYHIKRTDFLYHFWL